jgi:hypothetical protein
MTIETLIIHFEKGDLQAFSKELALPGTNICETDYEGRTIMHFVVTAEEERPSNYSDFLKLLAEEGGKALIDI